MLAVPSLGEHMDLTHQAQSCVQGRHGFHLMQLTISNPLAISGLPRRRARPLAEFQEGRDIPISTQPRTRAHSYDRLTLLPSFVKDY